MSSSQSGQSCPDCPVDVANPPCQQTLEGSQSHGIARPVQVLLIKTLQQILPVLVTIENDRGHLRTADTGSESRIEDGCFGTSAGRNGYECYWDRAVAR